MSYHKSETPLLHINLSYSCMLLSSAHLVYNELIILAPAAKPVPGLATSLFHYWKDRTNSLTCMRLQTVSTSLEAYSTRLLSLLLTLSIVSTHCPFGLGTGLSLALPIRSSPFKFVLLQPAISKLKSPPTME